jgi:molybdate transport system substrate-binding protein
LALALVTVSACAGGSSSTDPGGGGDQGGEDEGLGDITVFAASSLTEAFTELGAMLEEENADTKVTFNFASSSDLALQINEGAPADAFASADPVRMKVVEDEGLSEDPVVFATNKLVVLVPADNPAGIQGPEDLAKPGVKLVLAAPEVPAGNYARQAFEALGIADKVEANVVSNEDDVKAVVTKVSLGEADAGVTYVTDATAELSGKVEANEFPSDADVTATYSIATLKDAPNAEGAEAFYDLVLSEDGQGVLAAYGFGPP